MENNSCFGKDCCVFWQCGDRQLSLHCRKAQSVNVAQSPHSTKEHSMSTKQQSFRGFDRRSSIAEEAAEDGYDFRSAAGRNGLIARSVAEAGQCNRKWSVGMGFKPAYTYCPNGLIALSERGIKLFEEEHPDVLPWNLYKSGPGTDGYYAYNLECTLKKRDKLVSAHARFGGWIARAAKLPLLAKAIGQSVSSRGEGSRRTYVRLWALAEKYPSPQRLERKIAAVQRRAFEILKAYDGRGCTLRSSVIALSATATIGKAAVIAAYRSLTGKVMGKYSMARNALIELHACRVEDNTDGVAVHRSAEPVYNKRGVRIYTYVQRKSNTGWKRGYLVLHGRRSFHHLPERDYYGDSPRGALIAALAAWAKQKKLEREEGNLFRQLQPTGFVPLVYFQDSRDAGNCAEGTQAFMSRIGIPLSRKFVPITTLLPHVGDTRVRNTLKVVAEKLGRLQLAA